MGTSDGGLGSNCCDRAMKCLKVLRLDGPVSSASLEAMVWPDGLQRLMFGDYFNQPVAGVV